jgi:cellulose synthase/poly-beta-1,6-N-acetylglucosamine synthase-like glycosyltransferase
MGISQFNLQDERNYMLLSPFLTEMTLIWWVIFFIDLLFAAGLMSTYISRNDYKKQFVASYSKTEYKTNPLVIIPVKGVDYGLERNLRSIMNQDYGPFDVVAVVDSDDDPSVEFLRKVGINYMLSSTVCAGCSGKVRAIHSALVKHPNYGCYVIVDSDVMVSPSWLSKLLSPLSSQSVGASTTFPVFYPEGGFWSKMKMYWGLVGQSMMESNLTKFVWGGSMAFRRDLLDDESLKMFSESLSDDIAILQITRKKGLAISYVPESRPQIHSTDNFRTFMEWSNRQTAFSIYSSRKVFAFGITYYTIWIYILFSAIFLSTLESPIFLILLLPFFYNSVNSQRKVPVRVWYFLFLTFLLPFVYVWNLISGLTLKEVVWRGTVYSLSRRS